MDESDGLQGTGFVGCWRGEYQSLQNVFPFVAAVINRRTNYEKETVTTRMHTRNSEIVDDVTEDLRQRAWDEEYVEILKRRVKKFQEDIDRDF